MDPAVAQLYNNLVTTSVNHPYEDALRFLEFSDDCLMKLRLDPPTLASTGANSQILERHMKFLLLVQFEYTKSTPSHDSNSVDYKLSDWAAQILERLSLCSFNRSDWKSFIKNDLVDRFASTHGKTLAQIYMDIGLEPPSCLPHLDGTNNDDNDNDKVVDDPSSFFALKLENQLTSVQCVESPQREMPSPKTAKISARNSLPRALFSDSIVVPSNEGTPWPSTSRTSPESSSVASTSHSQPAGRVGSKYATRSKSGTSAPLLVLMPASKYVTSKSRRKTRTPVKRGSGQPSRSTMLGADSKSRRRRIPSGPHGGSGRCKTLHRSVAETPNPKMSQPRWERARMAAAEKTRGRSVIVAESPLKPSEPGSVISSPLRRLRRASSLLNFRRGDSSGGDCVGGVSSATSTSRLSAKAELWQRRQLEEEASLSQFSGGESNLSQSIASSAASLSSPHFLRRTSNLVANLISHRLPQSSVKNAKKPTFTSAVSSPPVLNLSKLKPEFSRPSPLSVASKGLSHDLDAPSSTTTSTPSTSAKPPAKRPSTTGATPKRRKTGSRGQMAAAEVPTSPHFFDEAAMFPGEGEFFQEIATDFGSSFPRRKIRPMGGSDPHTTPRKGASHLHSMGGGDGENSQLAMAKKGEVTPSRLRNPLTPVGNTRRALGSDTPGEQPLVGAGFCMKSRKHVLRLPSSGGGGNEDWQAAAGGQEKEECSTPSRFRDSPSPVANTCSAFQSEAFEWSPSASPGSVIKTRGTQSCQVTARRTTPRKGLFHPTASPLRAWSPGAKGRGILSFHQVTTRQTTPRKGLFRPVVSVPPPQAQDNVERQEETENSPRRRLRARRSLF